MDKKETILRKIKSTRGAVTTFVKIFNSVCPMCKLKINKSKGSLPLNQYCHKCKKIVTPMLEKLKERMDK